MNNERRKMLRDAMSALAEVRAVIEQAASEEQDYLDNMPENMQDSDKAQRADEIASELTDIASEMEDLDTRIEECLQ